MLAPDGRCKSLDAAADGYVRGEAVGALFLKVMHGIAMPCLFTIYCPRGDTNLLYTNTKFVIQAIIMCFFQMSCLKWH